MMKSKKIILITASALLLIIFTIVCLSPSFNLPKRPSTASSNQSTVTPRALARASMSRVKSYRSLSNFQSSVSSDSSFISKLLTSEQDQDFSRHDYLSEFTVHQLKSQNRFNPCANNPCNYGICVANTDNQSHSCYCHNGYTGVDCSIDYNECKINPCLNHGTCIDGNDAYYCSCLKGFTGVNCEININDCSPINPCLNGGTCIDLINGYKCYCRENYTGDKCQIVELKLNDNNLNCTNGYCIHGKCFKNDGVHCICDTGYTGKRCEINIDDCINDPCLNGGSCFDYVNHYHCSCPLGEH